MRKTIEWYETGIKAIKGKIEQLEQLQSVEMDPVKKLQTRCQINNLRQTNLFYEEFVKEIRKVGQDGQGK